MKIGSLVVVKTCYVDDSMKHLVKWMPIQDEETIYVVRDIPWAGAAYLEEGVIGFVPNDSEIGISFKVLIEVQPPMNLEEIMEAVNADTLEV